MLQILSFKAERDTRQDVFFFVCVFLNVPFLSISVYAIYIC